MSCSARLFVILRESNDYRCARDGLSHIQDQQTGLLHQDYQINQQKDYLLTGHSKDPVQYVLR